MYIHVIFNPNQVKKPQGNKVVQYFKILNSVWTLSLNVLGIKIERWVPILRSYKKEFNIVHKLTKMKLRKYNFRSEKLLSTSQKVFCFKTCNNLSLSKLCNLKPDWRKKVFGRTQFICLINLICQNCLKWKKLSTLLYIISIWKAKYLMGFRFPSLL